MQRQEREPRLLVRERGRHTADLVRLEQHRTKRGSFGRSAPSTGFDWTRFGFRPTKIELLEEGAGTCYSDDSDAVWTLPRLRGELLCDDSMGSLVQSG